MSRESSQTSASSRLGASALILDFTELLDTTAAGPAHVLSALKVATNEAYCLGSYTLQVIYMCPSKAYLRVSQSGPARRACHDRQARVRPTLYYHKPANSSSAG